MAALAAGLLGLCAPGALAAVPNDPSFSLQWGDSNTGQPIPTQESEEVLGPEVKGTPSADDRALEAWGVSTGSSSIVIGETDTGVEYEHPDLKANVWTNPGGIGGCAAGTRGFNVLESARECEPIDEESGPGSYGGHGTHVAGIMGAVGNNGEGVAGMNWHTSILPVKWLSSAGGSNSTENLVKALQKLVEAKQAGVNIRVVNDSPTFRGTPSSSALSHEIDVLGENNILFVTAAGNSGVNIDQEKNVRYPCGYEGPKEPARPNEICVTATDNNDQLPSWADYGPSTVDLAAPGESIYSTLRGNKYGYLSGGSMAAAQVSGAAALILSAKPSLTAVELKAEILKSVDKLPSLKGKVRTEGRLDVAKALPGAVTSISPSGGPAIGGTSVTITGANLGRTTAVKFGATNASSFTINSSTSITATSPAGAGPVDVTVTAPGGTSVANAGDRFGYEPEAPPAPTVTGVSPASGPTAGASSVTITGSNLSGATAVKFGAADAAAFTVDSPTSISATSPAGTGTVDVTVTTPAGTSSPVAGDRFGYVAETPPAPHVQTQPAGTTEPPSTSIPSTSPGQSSVLGTTTSSSAIVLATSTATVQHGRAAIRLRCVGTGTCTSTLTVAVKLQVHRRGKPTTSKLQPIGRAGFSLRAGQTASVTVTLNAAGRSLLSAAHGKLDGLLTTLASAGSSGAQTKVVHLRATTSVKKSGSR